MMSKNLAAVHAVSMALLAVLTYLTGQYPHLTWLPVITAVLGIINLQIPSIIQSVTAAPAVTVPKEGNPS